MNLEDVIDPEYGLQQDEWALSKPRFGEYGQLEVVGWSGKTSTHKRYITKCDLCSEDKELFGDGYFLSGKSNLRYDRLPCGCSKSTRYSSEQWDILLNRKASMMGYKYTQDGSVSGKSKVRLTCKDHGEWSCSVNSFLNNGSGCPCCASEHVGRCNSKPDEEMIQSFFASGAFHPDTKFWRSNKKNKRGHSVYWDMYCPQCDSNSISYAGHLQAGKRPCDCSQFRQKFAYIHILNDGVCDIGLKFGVANNCNNRLTQQNSRNPILVKSFMNFEFQSKERCFSAEAECKEKLECGVVSKHDMPDGFTETTYLYNIENIVEIYKKYGGVMVT